MLLAALLLFLGVSGSALESTMVIRPTTPVSAQYLAIAFADGVLPYLRSASMVNAKLLTSRVVPGVVVFEVRDGFEIRVGYLKRIRKSWPIDVEGGLDVARVFLIDLGAPARSVKVSDRVVIPDFTTPFLAYGVAGTILCGYVSSMIKLMSMTYP